MNYETVLLFPELTNKEAEKKWTNRPIDPSSIKYRPTVSTYYQTPDGKAKLLLLKSVLGADLVAKQHDIVRRIKYNPAKDSKRACLRGSPGGDILFGYNDALKPDSTGRRQTHPQLTSPSVKQFRLYRGIWPLCWKMEDLLEHNIPTYWNGRRVDERHGPAFRHEDHRSDFFNMPDENRKRVEAEEDWNFSYSIGGSNFTTITVNHNTRFLAHKDANNSSGAMSCMAVFGTFGGGELAFPRLGVAIDAKPGDMLVCDCPQELHGTLATSQGNRYSVVVYTREGLTRQGIMKTFAKGNKAWHEAASVPQEGF